MYLFSWEFCALLRTASRFFPPTSSKNLAKGSSARIPSSSKMTLSSSLGSNECCKRNCKPSVFDQCGHVNWGQFRLMCNEASFCVFLKKKIIKVVSLLPMLVGPYCLFLFGSSSQSSHQTFPCLQTLWRDFP